MRLEIDRSKWSCGKDTERGPKKSMHGKGPTELLNDQGYMCCLGFRALASGVLVDDIRNALEPCDIFTEIERYPDSLLPLVFLGGEGYAGNSLFAKDAMLINDNCKISRADREGLLIQLAKSYGEEWVFVGEYEDE